MTVFVAGHMAYRAAMPRLLRHVGWEVESDEFVEISDPDPDNHEGRQRELIREIEDARKEAQEKPEKRRFGFFKRGKLAEKKSWEMYDEKMGEAAAPKHGGPESPGKGVLFDIEAIKRELESEQMEVRQLESTLPPMRIELSKPDGVSPAIEDMENTAKSDDISNINPLATMRSRSPDATTLESSSKEELAPQMHISEPLPEEIEYGHAADVLQSRTHDDDVPAAPQSAPLPPAAVALEESDKTSARPELRSANTMPAEKNAWAYEEDEQEEQWGKEREVIMSFE